MTWQVTGMQLVELRRLLWNSHAWGRFIILCTTLVSTGLLYMTSTSCVTVAFLALLFIIISTGLFYFRIAFQYSFSNIWIIVVVVDCSTWNNFITSIRNTNLLVLSRCIRYQIWLTNVSSRDCSSQKHLVGHLSTFKLVLLLNSAGESSSNIRWLVLSKIIRPVLFGHPIAVLQQTPSNCSSNTCGFFFEYTFCLVTFDKNWLVPFQT